MQTRHWSRKQVADRFGCSVRKVDRLRLLGLLPWIDLTAGIGKKPTVRIRLEDIIAFETKCLMDINKNK